MPFSGPGPTAIVEPKPLHELVPTDVVFQTGFWGATKNRLGLRAKAFDFCAQGVEGDILVLEREIAGGIGAAYVPHGPEAVPDEGGQGALLESLSIGVAPRLDPGTVFLRWDLPWPCPYCADRPDEASLPEPRVREMRMNFGTETWKLRVAATDVLPPTTVVLDLTPPLDDLLVRMKSKTRYNIRLARRKGVRAFRAPASMIPCFHELVRQTAIRDQFLVPSIAHLNALFDSTAEERVGVDASLLLASFGDEVLAGALVLYSGRTAIYLYGASSDAKRNLMAPYAVQWEILREAKARGCEIYDMFGASLPAEQDHPLQGVTRFKRGFGARFLRRHGTWDFPFDEERYGQCRMREMIARYTDRGAQ